MNKKPREVGFVVVDDRALLGVIYTHLKHFETMDDGVVVSDDLDRRITDFDSGEFFFDVLKWYWRWVLTQWYRIQWLLESSVGCWQIWLLLRELRHGCRIIGQEWGWRIRVVTFWYLRWLVVMRDVLLCCGWGLWWISGMVGTVPM